MQSDYAPYPAVDQPQARHVRSAYVDVDASPGIDYGTSLGGAEPWPGAEGARKVTVQYDLDWERFIQLFERVSRASRTPQ